MRLGPRTEGLVLKVPLYIEEKHILRPSTPKLSPSSTCADFILGNSEIYV